MEIRVVQRFPCSPQRLWAILRDAEFEKESRKQADMDVVILRSEERGNMLFERFRITSHKELPALMRSATGADRLSYEQEMESDNLKFTTRWKILPSFAQDKVKCEGSSKLIATPDGCERIVTGDLKVSVPFVGGKIEQAIVSELEAGYAKTAQVISRFLQKG